MQDQVDLRFIVYFDFLGFSKFVAQNPLSKAREELSNAIGEINTFLNEHKKVVLNGTVKEPVKGRFWFSDTLIFYSGDNDPNNLSTLTGVASYSLASLLNRGFPTRCVITLGEFFVGNLPGTSSGDNFFIGNGLIETYRLEKEMEWCGGILNIKSENALRGVLEQLEETKEISTYSVPFKNERKKNYFCLNWPKYYQMNFKKNGENLRGDMEKFSSFDSCKEKNKFQNTKFFYENYLKL